MAKSNSGLLRRKNRVRNKIRKVSVFPRLSVFVSGLHTYAQIIDDSKSITMVYVGTVQKDFAKLKIKCNVAAAKEVGLKVGEVALKQGITKVVFDKGAKDYHGRVEALANGAREAGLQF
jgi:large subunit ribosomal protein L18